MTEVEKLYSLAGVEKERHCTKVNNCSYFECAKCEYYNYTNYPPFTAEKQIELIKWLMKSFDIDFSQIGQRIDTSLDGINCICGIGSADVFEDSLCMAIIDIWQDLTEEEQEQIREILK